MKADTLTVFVPTRLVNPTNAREFWAVRMKRAKVQREAVAAMVWSAVSKPAGPWVLTSLWTPKCITFVAHVARKMDSDGLQASLKACRDGLQRIVIDSDGPESGHVFEYTQLVAKPLGVQITVTLLKPRGPACPL